MDLCRKGKEMEGYTTGFMLSFFVTNKCTVRRLRLQCLSAQQAKVRPWVFLMFLCGFLTPCCECRGKKTKTKTRLANKTSPASNMLRCRQDELDYRHKPREGPWTSVTSSLCFSLSNHLILDFFGKRPKKKKEDIISIQFVRSLCERTDRLSYFGHTPRGELWGTGGGRGADKRPFLFTPDHYCTIQTAGEPSKSLGWRGLYWTHDCHKTSSVHSNSAKTRLSLPSWSHPRGLSRVWVGPAAAPSTTSQWWTTPESFLCWGCGNPSCWRRCSGTAPYRGQRGPAQIQR